VAERTERGSRRLARETALAALFSEEFGRTGEPAPVAGLPEPEGEPPEYALVLVEGVRSHRDELDERIGSASHHWRIERMSLIDRNIIRIGAFEILFVEEVSTAVAINEAVEIARRYGDTDSWSFVNGVLDAVARAAEER
jgi:N utilization substance protein B